MSTPPPPTTNEPAPPARRTRGDIRLFWIALFLAILPLLDLALPASARLAPLLPPVLIYALVALGLTLVTGFTGLLHLGVAAFVALGAYTFAITTCAIYPFQLPWTAGVVLAAAVGFIAGTLLAVPTIRLRGDYLAIVTLGFEEIVQDTLRNLEAITKGTQGINPLPAPSLGPLEITGATPLRWYYLLLLLLLATAWIVQRIVKSSIGRAWIALRDDQLAASCSGIDPARVKLWSFASSAALCAVAGAVLASFLGSSGEPGNYDFQLSIMALSMVIVGGLGSIPGAILGAILMVGINSIALTKLSEWMTRGAGTSAANVFLTPANWKYMIFGVTLVVMMRWKPAGLMPPPPVERR